MKDSLFGLLGFFAGLIISILIFSLVMTGYSKFACNEFLARLYLDNISSVLERLDRGDGLGALVIIDNLSRSQERLRHCPVTNFLGVLSNGAVYLFNPDGVMVSDESRNKELLYLRRRAEGLIASKKLN